MILGPRKEGEFERTESPSEQCKRNTSENQSNLYLTIFLQQPHKSNEQMCICASSLFQMKSSLPFALCFVLEAGKTKALVAGSIKDLVSDFKWKTVQQDQHFKRCDQSGLDCNNMTVFRRMWPMVTVLLLLSRTQAAGCNVDQLEDHQLAEFIRKMEQLVLRTMARALMITCNVYQTISADMSPPLQQATQEIIQDYIAKVEEALHTPDTNYSEKQKLLQMFRHNNRHIEQLRLQLEPSRPPFRFELISNHFYTEGGGNSTEFDNLYLQFMQEFQAASDALLSNRSGNVSDEVVMTTEEASAAEEREELFEILNAISGEKELSKRDKLYDEFIEMFLFKDGNEKMQTRELL